jgi:hypothetical protein
VLALLLVGNITNDAKVWSVARVSDVGLWLMDSALQLRCEAARGY